MARLLQKLGIISTYAYQMLTVKYFDIALSNVNLSATEPQAIVDNRVTKTFAMAIARQESDLESNGTIFPRMRVD